MVFYELKILNTKLSLSLARKLVAKDQATFDIGK